MIGNYQVWTVLISVGKVTVASFEVKYISQSNNNYKGSVAI